MKKEREKEGKNDQELNIDFSLWQLVDEFCFVFWVFFQC